jgi:hypothetical protein
MDILFAGSGNRRGRLPRTRSGVDLDNGIREGLRRFLGQVVPDASGDNPMRISP